MTIDASNAIDGFKPTTDNINDESLFEKIDKQVTEWETSQQVSESKISDIFRTQLETRMKADQSFQDNKDLPDHLRIQSDYIDKFREMSHENLQRQVELISVKKDIHSMGHNVSISSNVISSFGSALTKILNS